MKYKKTYRITTQEEIRSEFWESFPELSKKRITAYDGVNKMYCTDARCAFVDFLDMLSKDGDISPELAHRATLKGE